MQKTALVIGGTGFLGRYIVRSLQNNGIEVVSPPSSDLDVTDRDAVLQIVERLQPTIVVNCACITGYANCQKSPEHARAVNVNGVAHLVDACRRNNILLVQPSSASVFDGRSKRAYREYDPVRTPQNISAATKRAAEEIILGADIDYIMPRIATVYGPIHKRDTTNLLKMIVEQLRDEGETFPLFDDQMVNFAAVDEVARALSNLIARQFRGLIHLGGPETLSIWKFGRLVQKAFGLNGEIPKGSVQGTDYPPNMTLDVSLARQLGLSFSRPQEKMATFAAI